ncbi:MAG: hypothetical protein WBQ86_25380 [Candidatus Binatus sp.]
MNAAEKGELYARIFRKVGVYLGKGEIPRALKELNEGMKIAERNGDSKMGERFAQEIANVTKTAEPAK